MSSTKRWCSAIEQGLVVTSERLAPDEVQALTRELVASINRHTDTRAALPQGQAGAGERGDPITLGAIVLSITTSGTAIALFQVIKAYFERDESLDMVFTKAPEVSNLSFAETRSGAAAR